MNESIFNRKPETPDQIRAKKEADREKIEADREKRKKLLGQKREANKKAKEDRHDARIEKRGKRTLSIAAQNASGAIRRANAAKRRQSQTGTSIVSAAGKLQNARTRLRVAKNKTMWTAAANSAKFNAARKAVNLQKSINSSTEYAMSTVEIISESCMVGLNEDMYFKVKIEGLPTMYVNSANREELRKDLVGLLRNPSKAVGDIKRVTPQEVKKRLRLRSQGKEEEEMNESESDGYYMMTQAKKSAASAGEDYNDRSVADRHTAKVAKKMGYTHKDYTSGTYYKSRMPGSRLIESVEMNEAQIDKMKVVSKGFMGRKEAERHNDQLVGSGKASHKSYVHNHKDGKFYVVDIKAKTLQSSVYESQESQEGMYYNKQLNEWLPLAVGAARVAAPYIAKTLAKKAVKKVAIPAAVAGAAYAAKKIHNKSKEKNESDEQYDEMYEKLKNGAMYKALSERIKDPVKLNAVFMAYVKEKESTINEVTASDVTTAYQRAQNHPQGSEERKIAMNYYRAVKANHDRNPTDSHEIHAEDKNEPCWDSHEMIGMKVKNGKKVPNCVPKQEATRIIKDATRTIMGQLQNHYKSNNKDD